VFKNTNTEKLFQVGTGKNNNNKKHMETAPTAPTNHITRPQP
jgi:hypothetical protein